MNSLPMTVARHRRGCDLNPGHTAAESSTLTTRLPTCTNYFSLIVRQNMSAVSGCFGKSEVYFYGPLCGEGNAIGRVRPFFLLYLLNQVTVNLMFDFFMDITIADRKLKVKVISQGQAWGLGLEMER